VIGASATGSFLLGAKKTLEVCVCNDVCLVVLKSLSPSCGVGEIYDGTFGKSRRPGSGVTAALLKRAAVECVSEKDFGPLMVR